VTVSPGAATLYVSRTQQFTARVSGTSNTTVTLSATAPVSIGVFGTGVVSGSTLAADGSVDSHYTLSSSADSAFPGPNAYVVNASS